MTRVRITLPSSIEEAQDQLAGIEGLLTAKNWERAAIVAAFVQLDMTNVDLAARTSNKIKSPSEFASLGIVGLKSKDTVRLYVEAWQFAVEDGAAKPVKPGRVTILPDLPWPYDSKNIRGMAPDRRAAIERAAVESGLSANTIAQVVRTPAAVNAALKADPQLAATVVADPAVSRALNQAAARTDTGKEITRNMKAAQARDAETKPGPYTPMMLLPYFLEHASTLRDLLEDVTVRGTNGEDAQRMVVALGESLITTGRGLVAVPGEPIQLGVDEIESYLRGEVA